MLKQILEEPMWWNIFNRMPKPYSEGFLPENDGHKIDNTCEEEFVPWLEIVKSINPRSVMLYSIDRITPEKNLEKLLIPELERYADRVRELGIETKTY